MWRPATSTTWRDRSGRPVNSVMALGYKIYRLLSSLSRTKDFVVHSKFSAFSFVGSTSFQELVAQSNRLLFSSLQPGPICPTINRVPRTRLQRGTSKLLGASSASLAGFETSSGGKKQRMSSNDASQEVSAQMEETFQFGKFKISSSEVFVVTEHSFAFVNLKPVVPDVLVSSRRVVNRFVDLTSEEASDLWLTAKRIGQKIEPHFKATSLTFAIQDGPQAGQTVPHVHVHILPRKGSDFANNDDIYDVIDNKEKELSENLNLDKERKDRTFDEMASEAAQLRALF